MYVWSDSGSASRCRRCRDGSITAFSDRQIAALLRYGKGGVKILPGPDPKHPEVGATLEPEAVPNANYHAARDYAERIYSTHKEDCA